LTRFVISHLGLKIMIRWYPWYSAEQVLNLPLLFKQSSCCYRKVYEFEVHLVHAQVGGWLWSALDSCWIFCQSESQDHARLVWGQQIQVSSHLKSMNLIG